MINLPEGITLQMLQEQWDTASNAYTKAFKRATLLDAADRGRLWEAVKAKFPKYQILTDTNHVSYVKENLVASLYAIGKYSNIIPTSEDDKDIVKHLNIALENMWSISDISYFQQQAGDRAALLNLGITQIGWDNTIIGGSGSTNSYYKGRVSLKNIDPLKFRRDPYAEGLDSSAYCHTWDNFHKLVIKRNPNYNKEWVEYENKTKQSSTSTSVNEKYMDVNNKQSGMPKDHYRLIIHWVRDAVGEIHEIHTVDNKHVLYVKENLKPKGELPFCELFCNLPQGDVLGTSGPAKIFANSLAYNLMNSIQLTAEYKNQRPPRFISTHSGLNLNTFKKYGNEADHAFIVNGDASRAVHYQQFPSPSPALPALMGQLAMDVGKVTGVDDRYTGRDTGSIITTGGTEQMLDQVTLIDQPKINNYNRYSERLSMLVLLNMIEHSHKRKYFIKEPNKPNTYKTLEVDFPNIDAKTLFAYDTDVTPDLPRTKQRLAQAANVIMEKQMQYQATGQKVDWITPEEWLYFQDLPNKEYMLERMGVQRNEDYIEMASQVVFQYAALTENGMQPEEALVATAETIKQNREPGNQPDQVMPDLGPDQQGLPPLV
jgi:hypothetical protein